MDQGAEKGPAEDGESTPKSTAPETEPPTIVSLEADCSTPRRNNTELKRTTSEAQVSIVDLVKSPKRRKQSVGNTPFSRTSTALLIPSFKNPHRGKHSGHADRKTASQLPHPVSEAHRRRHPSPLPAKAIGEARERVRAQRQLVGCARLARALQSVRGRHCFAAQAHAQLIELKVDDGVARFKGFH